MINVLARTLVIFLIVFFAGTTGSVGLAASAPRMRPYAGIGLVVFSRSENILDHDLPLQLYEEPGLGRVGILKSFRLSGNEWVFGTQEGASPVIVSARKGDWLRLFYDDAGREAWIDPQGRGRFQTWEQYLKQQTGRMLPGLQLQYYKLQQQPGGRVLSSLTPKQQFKVLKVEDAWLMVLLDQAQIGWVRWCDDDGRLTVGTWEK